MPNPIPLLCALLPASLLAHAAVADTSVVVSPPDPTRTAAFDILQANVHRDGDTLTFAMTASAAPGTAIPDATGALKGAAVWSYVWPTSLDPAAVGFAAGTGILALAATSHPDFDDTPLYDENGDGDLANDGAGWHSHWVVLTPNEACGPAALSVRDIPEGETPTLPATWPGLPLFIDSPDPRPAFDGPRITVTLRVDGAQDARFDGVTAALRVNADLHAPLLCVTDLFDIASGDLSLPGRID